MIYYPLKGLKNSVSFQKFINSFGVDQKDYLICLSSGRNAPPTVCQDLLSVDSVGHEKFEDVA